MGFVRPTPFVDLARRTVEIDESAGPRPMRQALLSGLGACGLCLFSFSPAHAYLDAGTGSILLQAIIGAVAAGMAVLLGLRGRISAIFSRLKNKDAKKANSSNEAGET
jgi:hypothetical protein